MTNAGSSFGKKLVKGKFVKGQQNGGKTCSHCKKSGHTIDTCFRKHDFPFHFKKGQGSTVNNIASNDYENEAAT